MAHSRSRVHILPARTRKEDNDNEDSRPDVDEHEADGEACKMPRRDGVEDSVLLFDIDWIWVRIRGRDGEEREGRTMINSATNSPTTLPCVTT